MGRKMGPHWPLIYIPGIKSSDFDPDNFVNHALFHSYAHTIPSESKVFSAPTFVSAALGAPLDVVAPSSDT